MVRSIRITRFLVSFEASLYFLFKESRTGMISEKPGLATLILPFLSDFVILYYVKQFNSLSCQNWCPF